MSKGNRYREAARHTAAAYRRAVRKGSAVDVGLLGSVGSRYVTRGGSNV